MNRLLTLRNTATMLALVFLFFGCTKEPTPVTEPPKEEIKPQKIKSIVPKTGYKVTARINFTYFEDGKLRYVDMLSSGDWTDRLDYTYQANGQAKIVGYAPGSPWPDRGEIEFVYANDKLTGINVVSKYISVATVNYVFHYSGGLNPSSYTITSYVNKDYPDVRTFQLISDARGNITQSETERFRDDLEYDTQVNPLYKMPWMLMETRYMNYGAYMNNGLIYELDVARFFSPNNIKKATHTILPLNPDNAINIEESVYTYTEAGQPKEVKTELKGPFPGNSRTEYLYW